MADDAKFATYAKLLRLTPVESAPTVAPTHSLPPAAPGESETYMGQPSGLDAIPTTKRRAQFASLASFLLLMLLPTALTSGYFFFVAADRYESEARFVLRMPGRALANTAMASLIQPGAITRSNDDGYVVQEFLESRDALAWVEKNADIRSAFAAARWDPIWRFPNLLSSDSTESLFKHYRRMMSASFNSTTGLTTLKVEAFTPQDAQRIAQSLLSAAEALVNRLNERARRDGVGIAEGEADRMRKRIQTAQSALTAFREREQFIDPAQVTIATLETIGTLSLEVAKTSVEIAGLTSSSSNSPQLTSLRIRRAALESQIALERQRLAGSAQSIAPRIAEYERLMLEREFAEKALIAAMTAVETARLEALRQHVYLERVAAPGLPDKPAYPWRILWCLLTAAAGYMAWRTWRILAKDALRHTEL